MKKIFALSLLSLLLMSCNSSSIKTTNISEQNENPLTAARYGDALADALANLVITKNPVTQKKETMELIQSEIEKAKGISVDARMRMASGTQGAFIPIEGDTQGYALLLNKVLYFSSEFSTRPGINLHVYLTTVADPRAISFPDKNAVDLGLLQAAYGQQQYEVSAQVDPKTYRTLVLWDNKLKVMYAFAQLSAIPQ